MKKNLKKHLQRILVCVLALSLSLQAPLSVSAARTGAVSGKSSKKELKKIRQDRKNARKMKNLKKKVESFIRTSCPASANGKSAPTAWSVYVKDLKTDKSFTINNRAFLSASTIKLFAMAVAYDQAKKKKFTMTPAIEQQIYSMIAYSGNDAFNNLVYGRLGSTAINSYCKKNGYRHTEQYNPCRNSGAVNTKFNMTSASDCGKLLEKIYRKKLVSRSASAKMLGYLKSQTLRYKIPSGLPGGVASANKTGEYENVQNDTAIVFGKKTDYIICIFSNTCNSAQAISSMRHISRIVYDALN